MGVDCKIYLRPETSADLLTEVIGILAGCEKTEIMIGGIKESVVRVQDAKMSSVETVPTMCYISFTHKGKSHRWGLHFESHSSLIPGGKLLMPRSTAFNIAIGIALVDIFGGYIDYRDDDLSYSDYIGDPPFIVTSENDEGFRMLQNILKELEPLSKSDITDYEQHAAYR